MYFAGETRPFITGILLPAITNIFAPVANAIHEAEDSITATIGDYENPVDDNPNVESVSAIASREDIAEARIQLSCGRQEIRIPTNDGQELVILGVDINLAREIRAATIRELDGTDEERLIAAFRTMHLYGNHQSVEAALYLLEDSARRDHLLAHYGNRQIMPAILNDDVGFGPERDDLWDYAIHGRATHSAPNDQGYVTLGFLQAIDLSDPDRQIAVIMGLPIFVAASLLLVVFVGLTLGTAILSYGTGVVGGGFFIYGSGQVGYYSGEAYNEFQNDNRYEVRENLIGVGEGVHNVSMGAFAMVGGYAMAKSAPLQFGRVNTSAGIAVDEFVAPSFGPRGQGLAPATRYSRLMPDELIPASVEARLGADGGVVISTGPRNARYSANSGRGSVPPPASVSPVSLAAPEAASSVRPNWSAALDRIGVFTSRPSLPEEVSAIIVIEDDPMVSMGLLRFLRMIAQGNDNLELVMPAEIAGSSRVPITIARNGAEIEAVQASLGDLSARGNVLILSDHDIVGYNNGAQIIERWLAMDSVRSESMTIIGISGQESNNAAIVAAANQGGAGAYFSFIKNYITQFILALLQ
ncbi:MAG: hypothetical protein ABH859_03250 [Pseudomonadota bacterium]